MRTSLEPRKIRRRRELARESCGSDKYHAEQHYRDGFQALMYELVIQAIGDYRHLASQGVVRGREVHPENWPRFDREWRHAIDEPPDCHLKPMLNGGYRRPVDVVELVAFLDRDVERILDALHIEGVDPGVVRDCVLGARE